VTAGRTQPCRLRLVGHNLAPLLDDALTSCGATSEHPQPDCGVRDGLVLSTLDGGVRWSVQQRGTNPPLYGVSFIDSLHGWAVGSCSVIHTDNGGTTWLSTSKNIPDKWLNVVGTMNGTSNPSRSYIVCGHFDSLSPDPMNRAPGADDDANGTSVVLEAARILKDFPFLASIKFICFSGEEQWMLGSQHYAREASYAGEDIAAVLNFDMVGYGNPPTCNDPRKARHFFSV